MLAAVHLQTQAQWVALAALAAVQAVLILAVKVAVAAAAGAHPEALEETVVVVAEARQLLSTVTQPTSLSLAQFMARFLKEE